MTYLLDVNVLVSLGSAQHEHHSRTVAWVKSLDQATLATCSITELGFVRVSSGVSGHATTISVAVEALRRLKENPTVQFVFVADDMTASALPKWVKGHKQVTDGHLVSLAKAHGYKLASFDKSIPGAFVLPG